MGEMEKLSYAADAGTGSPTSARPEALWSARPRFAEVLGGLPARPESPSHGLERRLPRRAERLWNELRGGDRLPPAGAVETLLVPPFAGLSMLVSVGIGGHPRVLHAGEQLAHLGVSTEGLRACASGAAGERVADRLLGMALEAVAAGSPRHMDSDHEADVGGGPPGLLLRAVALPLQPAAPRREAGLAMVVVSWRTLLSGAETAELHRELRAAMAWLGGDMAGGSAA